MRNKSREFTWLAGTGAKVAKKRDTLHVDWCCSLVCATTKTEESNRSTLYDNECVFALHTIRLTRKKVNYLQSTSETSRVIDSKWRFKSLRVILTQFANFRLFKNKFVNFFVLTNFAWYSKFYSRPISEYYNIGVRPIFVYIIWLWNVSLKIQRYFCDNKNDT